MKNNFSKHTLSRLCSLVIALVLLATCGVSALSAEQKKIYQQGIHYFDIDVASCSSNSSASSSSGDISTAVVALSGSDNPQKAYNFYVSRGFTPQQSAAIVGNFIAESSVLSTSNQANGGAGQGIAQWGGGRLDSLKTFAQKNNADPYALATQLAFTIEEINGGYKAVIDKFKQQTNISDMTAYFMGTTNAGLFPGNVVDSITQQYIAKYGRFPGYENPGSPRLDDRIVDAKAVLHKYGGGDSEGNAGSVTDSGVSGVDAGVVCGDTTTGQSASVDCTPSASDTAATSTVSQLRQKVVCLTQAELALWTSGKMKAGTDFYKYSQGNYELWCADFTSWIYKQAGYPVGPSDTNWRVPAVSSVMQIGQQNKKFHYHAAGGYIPKPGDMIIHKEGESHVNIVISVNANNSSMVITGGDQHGSGGAGGNVVNSYTAHAFSSTDGITGYVSPD